MAAKVYAKYLLEPDARDVHGRFTALYNSSSKGKQLLTSQCVAGGMLLKECGLLELAISICESEAYIKATAPSQRRALLLGELGALTGGLKEAAVGLPSAPREFAAPMDTSEVIGEQPAPPDATESNAAAPEEQPAQQNKRPQVRQLGVELPNIGASSSKK